MIAVNPVLARELKERMRARWTWFIVTVYLAVLAGLVVLVYEVQSGGDVGFGQSSVLSVSSAGRSIFEWLVFMMLLLVMFLVPALTAGAIAGERDRQTLVPLQVSLLRPRSILFGKLAASLAFIGLLIVASVPMLAVCYLIGGVSMSQVVRAVVAVAAVALVVAAISITVSTFMRRVQGATVVAYGVVLFLAVGTAFVYGAAAMIDRSRGFDATNPPAELLLLNPVVGAVDFVRGDEGNRGSSPFDPVIDALVRSDGGGSNTIVRQGPNGAIEVTVASGGEFSDFAVFDGGFGPQILQQGDDRNDGFPYWLESFLLLLGVAVIGLVLSAWRLRTPARQEGR